MPRPFRARLAVVAGASLAVVAMLTGCVPSDPMPDPPPTPDVQPVFASDEEALAAAEEAYGEYLAMGDQILVDGGRNPERLAPFTTEEQLSKEVASFERLRERGWRGTGTTSFRLTLQRFDSTEIVVYACDDLTDTELVDKDGTSVVSESRPDQVATEVRLEGTPPHRIAAKAPWDGAGVC